MPGLHFVVELRRREDDHTKRFLYTRDRIPMCYGSYDEAKAEIDRICTIWPGREFAILEAKSVWIGEIQPIIVNLVKE